MQVLANENHRTKWWLTFAASSVAEMRRVGPAHRAARRFATQWHCHMPWDGRMTHWSWEKPQPPESHQRGGQSRGFLPRQDPIWLAIKWLLRVMKQETSISKPLSTCLLARRSKRLEVVVLNPLRFSHQTRFRLWQTIHQHSKNPELALAFRRALALLGIETWETAAFSVSWLCTLSFCSLSITISCETDPGPIFSSWFRSKLSRRSCKRVESQSSSSKLTCGTILTTFFLGEMTRWHDASHASRVRPEKNAPDTISFLMHAREKIQLGKQAPKTPCRPQKALRWKMMEVLLRFPDLALPRPGTAATLATGVFISCPMPHATMVIQFLRGPSWIVGTELKNQQLQSCKSFANHQSSPMLSTSLLGSFPESDYIILQNHPTKINKPQYSSKQMSFPIKPQDATIPYNPPTRLRQPSFVQPLFNRQSFTSCARAWDRALPRMQLLSLLKPSIRTGKPE